jgi:hypothetical protein
MFLILLLPLLLTGCGYIEMAIEMPEGGGGTFTVYSGLSRDFMEAWEMSPEDLDMQMEESGVDTGALEELEGVTVDTVEGSFTRDGLDYEGSVTTLTFEDEKTLFEEEGLEESGMTLEELEEGVYRYMAVFEGEAMTEAERAEAQQGYAMLRSMGMKMLVSFTTDQQVYGHNAHRVEGDTYTWDLLSLDPSQSHLIYLDFGTKDQVSDLPEPVLPEPPQPVDPADLRATLEAQWDLDPADPEYYGKALEKLGILSGTGQGLELDRPLSRIEGMMVYFHLLGVGDELEQFLASLPAYESGFSDVPAWGESIVDYLHYRGLVSGQAADRLGASSAMKDDDLATLILRAMGIRAFNWADAHETLAAKGLYRLDPNGAMEASDALTRGEMSRMVYNALFLETAEGRLLIETHLEQ